MTYRCGENAELDKPLLDTVTEFLHERIYDHRDPKRGPVKDCESCRKMARELINIFVADTLLAMSVDRTELSSLADTVRSYSSKGVTH